MFKPIVCALAHVLLPGRIAEVSIKQVLGIERPVDLVLTRSSRIVFSSFPHLILKVVGGAVGALSHLAPEIPKDSDVVIVSARRLRTEPWNDTSGGIDFGLV